MSCNQPFSATKLSRLATPNRDEAAHRNCYSMSMFGLFDLFGRSASLKALDHALREAGLHPLLVPDAVKLTILQLCKKEGVTRPTNQEDTYGEAAQLLSYCMLGQDQFSEGNGVSAADRAQGRFDAAIVAGDSFDAKLILLALHSGLIAPEIADRFDVEDK